MVFRVSLPASVSPYSRALVREFLKSPNADLVNHPDLPGFIEQITQDKLAEPFMSEYWCRLLTITLHPLPVVVTHQPSYRQLDGANKGSIATADSDVSWVTPLARAEPSMTGPDGRSCVITEIKLQGKYPHCQTAREVVYNFEGEMSRAMSKKAIKMLWKKKKFYPAPVLLVVIVKLQAWVSLLFPVKKEERLFDLCQEINPALPESLESGQDLFFFAKVTVVSDVTINTSDKLARVLSVVRHWVENNPMRGMTLEQSWTFRPHVPEPFFEPEQRHLWEYVKPLSRSIHVFKLRPQHQLSELEAAKLRRIRTDSVGDSADNALFVFKEFCNYLRSPDEYNLETFATSSERRAPPDELLAALRGAKTAATTHYKLWQVDEETKAHIAVLRYPYVVGSHRPQHREHWLQILKLVDAMHKAGFVHGDILPRNMVFPNTADAPAALIDFDMARKVDDGFYVQGYNHSAFESVRHENARAGKPMKREHDVHSLAVLSKRYFW
jgi:hypothetical protein